MKGIVFYLGQGHNEVYAVETAPLSKDKPNLKSHVRYQHGTINWGCIHKDFPRKNGLILISEEAANRLAPALIEELNAQE